MPSRSLEEEGYSEEFTEQQEDPDLEAGSQTDGTVVRHKRGIHEDEAQQRLYRTLQMNPDATASQSSQIEGTGGPASSNTLQT